MGYLKWNVYDYNGEYSVTFTNPGKGNQQRDTWTDWGLIPSSRYSEPINPIWSQKVEVAGVNGEEDLVRKNNPFWSVNNTALLQSEIDYDNRDNLLNGSTGISADNTHAYDIFQASSGSLSYIIADQKTDFFVLQQDIINFLHNQKVYMKFKTGPSTKTYTVRTTVESITSGEKYSAVSIAYSMLSGD